MGTERSESKGAGFLVTLASAFGRWVMVHGVAVDTEPPHSSNSTMSLYHAVLVLVADLDET